MDQMLKGQDIGRRQKIRRIEVLLAAYREARTQEWFEGKTPSRDHNREDRGEATKDLVRIGLLEKDYDYPGPKHPHPYRLTVEGLAFVEDVIGRFGKGGRMDWKRVKEIEFPSW